MNEEKTTIEGDLKTAEEKNGQLRTKIKNVSSAIIKQSGYSLSPMGANAWHGLTTLVPLARPRERAIFKF